MKEIILIGDHPVTKERQLMLLSLIQKLKSSNRKIALASHFLVPNFIVDLCDYFLYTKENPYYPIEEDQDSPRQNLHLLGLIFSSNEFISPDLSKDYRYSCFLQFCTSGLYLKNLGYDIIHYVEGDTPVDVNEISENFNILERGNHDLVVYRPSEVLQMVGSFFSFRTDASDFSSYSTINFYDFSKEMKKHLLLENFTKSILGKNPYVKNYWDYEFLKTDHSNDPEFYPNRRTRQSFFKIDDGWVFLIWNSSDKKVKVDLFSQIGELNCSFELEPNLSNLLEITSPITDQFLFLQVDGNLIKKYELTSDMEQFRFNTCIKEE